MIFSLFKSKPLLKELIPAGFVDIHSHILPEIDDGAKNIEESINLISAMKKLGFGKIIGTPHTYPGIYNNSNETIKKSFNKLKNKFNDYKNISFASEYMIDTYLIEKAESKSLLTIKSNFVLIEMSYINSPIDLYEIIFKISINGFIPILAHPERYNYLFNDIGKYKRLKNAGCKFQMNLLSTTGYYGKEVLKISDKLLNLNMIDFVGSDIHNLNHVNYFNKIIRLRNIRKIEKCIENNFSLG